MDSMIIRINSTPELEPYRDTILYDWPNITEHVAWICTGPVAEIIDWAEAVNND